MTGYFAPGLKWTTVIDAASRSLLLALTVSLLTAILGSLFAWLVSRTDLPARRILHRMLRVPFGLPSYLIGMAWIVLANPTVGLFKVYGNGCYGFWGMTVVETFIAFGFVYLEMINGFERMDPALEEAARMSGASPVKTFFTVSLPLLVPSLWNGVGLAFLYTLSSFGVPALLGLPVREQVLTTLIYSQLRLGGFSGFSNAMNLAGILLAFSFAVLAFVSWSSARRRARLGAIQSGKSSRTSSVELGRLKTPSFILVLLFLSAAVFLPWIALGLSALSPVAGDFHPARWTLKNMIYVFSMKDFKEGMWNSLLLAFSASALLCFAGFFLGYGVVRKKSKILRVLVELGSIPFSVPGSVLALLVVIASIRIGMDSALMLLMAAYLIKFAAVPFRIFIPAFSQVDPTLEEAARMCGASSFTAIRSVWWPLLKKVAQSAVMMSFVLIFTELTMSVLLTGPGAATVGTVLFQLQEYADQPSAACLGWLLLTIALGASLFMSLVGSQENERKHAV